MNLEKLLTDLESRKISASQAQEKILEALNDTRTNKSIPEDAKGWFQTGVDCVMIRFELTDFLQESI